MAEHTKIAWATSSLFPERFSTLKLALVANAIRFEVRELVTAMAERNAIAHVVSQLRMLGKWLDMMSAEAPAARVAAYPTRVVVADEYGVSPDSIPRIPPTVLVPFGSSVRVCVVVFPASNDTGNNFAQVLFRFLSPRDTLPRCWFATMGRTHFPLSRFTMPVSLERGHPSLERLAEFFRCRSWSVSAKPANRRQTIIPGRVFVKALRRLPCPASVAELQPLPNMVKVILDRAPGFLGANLQCAFVCLGHRDCVPL